MHRISVNTITLLENIAVYLIFFTMLKTVYYNMNRYLESLKIQFVHRLL